VGQRVGQLVGQLWGQLWGQLELPQFMWGGEELYWIAWLMAGGIAGVRYDNSQIERLQRWEEINKSCGWYVPYDGLVICCERHKSVHFDAERRLHSSSGPAILCRDGYTVHCWHGTRVPSEWIERPEELTAEVALTWENIEQRRCAAEILGWEKILEEINALTIDKDTDPEIGELVEAWLPGEGGPSRERFLRVRCGTGRSFALPVPPEMQTALEANAWTYGVDGDLIKQKECRT